MLLATNMWEEIPSFLAPYRAHKIFVGCSGGLDSMALLHYLNSNGYDIHALHVNYHKRGEESDADQDLVSNFCKTNSIPFTTRDFKGSPKGNFQEQARQFRYDFFEEIANANSGVIALAHHSDDQIETFCMNLMRKSGVLGLASMPRVRKNYIRPFLKISKKDIFTYAETNLVPWREDASNLEANYLRNKWRLEFLPIMEREYPSIRTSILKLVEACQWTQQQLEIKLNPLANQIKIEHKIDLHKIKQLSSEECFELWRQLEQPAKLFHRFQELLNYSSGKQIEGSASIKSIHNYKDELQFEFAEGQQFSLNFEQSEVSELPDTFSKKEVYLDPTKISGPLKLRPWQQGDRISSIGISGTQLVSKVIKDAGIPTHKRASVLVLHDDQQILWIVGLKISRNALADKSKVKHFKIRIK